ncbi:MAG: hypothetical protein AAF528_07090 [Cyanobacteria bacterium P01_C01_bin.121]
MAQMPDWIRLQKALSVEAETGFNDLQGHQKRFSEFLRDSLRRAPAHLTPMEQEQWHTLSEDFDKYSALTFAQRQHLVAHTRRFLQENRQKSTQPHVAETGNPPKNPKSQRTKTKSLQPKATGAVYSRHPLEQAITYLKGIGPKNSERLAKLGLLTVRDVLYYYPRDHLDYARQVKIRDLKPGETVTIVGTVRRCNCFNSPRNAKLSIFELSLYDGTGTLKIGRFFAGARFRNRSWQERQKRLYPMGSTVAASGLVKKGKYGITLDDPDLEVLGDAQDEIDSETVGRVVPVYPLTEGVPAALVRKAVVAALPAAVEIRDPFPSSLREQHGLVQLPVAIAHIHFPPDSDALALARRRLVFDEFFYLQLGLLSRRKQQQAQTQIHMAPTGELIDQFYEVLPFQLTGAQNRVVQEILVDVQQLTATTVFPEPTSPCTRRFMGVSCCTSTKISCTTRF